MVALSIGGFFYGVSGLLPGRSRGRVSDAQMTGPSKTRVRRNLGDFWSLLKRGITESYDNVSIIEKEIDGDLPTAFGPRQRAN